MENLYIEASKYTPEVMFDASSQILEIKGESYPENTAEFYAPVFSWINELLEQAKPDSQLTINMEIIYFNSSSSKVLMDLFDLFEDRASQGMNIQVNWIYDEENESALEYGEEFQEDLNVVEFNLQVKE